MRTKILVDIVWYLPNQRQMARAVFTQMLMPFRTWTGFYFGTLLGVDSLALCFPLTVFAFDEYDQTGFSER